MKEIQKTTTVYLADDGKEFLDKDSCEKYEKILNNIFYFKVMHTPDLNETGLFTKATIVAVYSGNYHHYDIVQNWCVKNMGYPIIMPSVMGFGFQPGFDIIANGPDNEIKDLWGRFKKGGKVNQWQAYTFPTFHDKVFLSPIEIDGFPKPFNYVEEWGLKA